MQSPVRSDRVTAAGGRRRGTSQSPLGRRSVPASVVAVLVAAVLVAGCAVAGWWLTRHGYQLHLGNTFPVTGRYALHASVWLAVPILLAAGVWVAASRLVRRIRWPVLLLASYLTAVVWAVALARVGGPDALTHPLTPPWEYLADVERIDAMGIGTYLTTFTEFIVEGEAGPGWANHVAGHPPLLTLLFVLLSRAGLPGPGWAAALCVGIGAAAVPAVLSTTRLLAGEGFARRAAPFLAAAPVALWVATSADAIIAGVAATAIAVLAHAAVRVRVPAAAVLAAGSGVLFGATLLLSYGMVLLAPIAVAVVLALRWRRWWLLAIAALGVVVVLAAAALAGFWWLDGLALTAQRVRIGQGWSDRPTGYFLFANLAALAVAVGPAAVAGLPTGANALRRAVHRSGTGGSNSRQRPGSASLALLPAAALLAVVLATASNLSKGEVERIWLPFAVWILLLAALLPRANSDDPPARGWLAAHLAWPIVVSAGTTLSW